MANTNTITFRIGEETRPVLETENLHESIFSELYQKAFAEIDNYIGKVSNINNDEKGGYNYEGVNNIFAFIGERGAGKTSCMMSVAKALENKGNNLSLINGLENIKQTTFLNSVLIDPSFFDQKNNILSLIIAHLFQSFRDQASKKDCKNDEEKRRTLIACFEKVQKNMNHLFPKDNSLSTDTLEGLVNFSAAVDLQKNIKALIDAYLDFMSEDKAKVLVLMIDDIDLHTNHAREMVEQIRKYFIQLNVVVLMAVKIDQLSYVIKNGLSDEYKSLIKNNEMSFDLINEMVERYLGKLLPHNHRIYLPEASGYFHSELKLVFKDRSDKVYPSVREGVLSLIFEKTRYLFYNTIDNTSYIIPRNLRELRQIIVLLANMSEYQVSKDKTNESIELKNKESYYNKALFKKYFLETWCPNNLDTNGCAGIIELFSIRDSLQINKSCILILSSYFKSELNNIVSINNSDDQNYEKSEDDITEDGKELPEYMFSFTAKYKEEIQRILNVNNFNYNISLGDVMAVIDYLSLIVNEEKKRKLIFAIKFLYSLRLYEFYDELTEGTQVLFPENNNSNNNKSVLRSDVLSNFADFTKLTAGSFLNLDVFELLRKNTKTKENRAKRKIDINSLKSLIEKRDSLAEFFMLCISMRQDIDNQDVKFRENTKIRFVNDFTKAKKAWFDLGSVFFNMMDIQAAYRRFTGNDVLFNNLLENNESLISKIIFEVLKRDYDNKNITDWFKFIQGENKLIKTRLDAYKYILPRIQSWVAIRNIEVFDDLKYYFTQNIPKKSGIDSEHISDFFSTLSSEYNIKTYDYNSDGGRYQINWNIFQLFAKIINLKKDSFDRIFNSCITLDEIKDLQLKISLLEEKLNKDNDELLSIQDDLAVLIIEINKYEDFIKLNNSMLNQSNITIEGNKQVISNLEKQETELVKAIDSSKHNILELKKLITKDKNKQAEEIDSLKLEISFSEDKIKDDSELLKGVRDTIKNLEKANKDNQTFIKDINREIISCRKKKDSVQIHSLSKSIEKQEDKINSLISEIKKLRNEKTEKESLIS